MKICDRCGEEFVEESEFDEYCDECAYGDLEDEYDCEE